MLETGSPLIIQSVKDLPPIEDEQAHNFIDEIKRKLSRYQRLSGDEKTQFLMDSYAVRMNGQLPYYIINSYPILIKDTETSHFYGYDLEKGTLEDQVLGQCIREVGLNPIDVATHAFQTVVDKYAQLRAELADRCKEKADSRVGFPFRITKQRNFSVPSFGGGGELVGFGQAYLYSIARALLAGNEESLQQVLTSMEAQFFHELLHQLFNEDNLNTQTGEEMTLLGEFLYDPAQNTERNEIFTQMSEFILDEAGTKAVGKWSESYDRPWQKVDTVLLIHELVAIGLLTESNLENLKQVLQALPKYYAQLSEEKRMNILKKYIVLNKTELYAHCQQLARQHNLTFAF